MHMRTALRGQVAMAKLFVGWAGMPSLEKNTHERLVGRWILDICAREI